MPQLEDQYLIDNQLRTTCQNTPLEQDVQLDINCSPKTARLTKIMITLGGRNSYPDAIVDMMMAGANIVRLNMSHQQEKWHAITLQSIREAGNRMYEYTSDIYPLGVAMNLQGPEIRTGIFNGDETNRGYAKLIKGNTVKLVTNDTAKRGGCAKCFWTSYPNLPRVCRPGDKILIDRGAALLQVKCVRETSIVCEIIKEGVVGDEKLVQLLDSAVSLPQISETDNEHVSLASMLECDIVIVNHARNEKMVHGIKSRLKHIGASDIRVIAKISTQQGLENFDEILNAADGILLDRDSVEVAVGPEKLFLVEKIVITKCMNVGKPVTLGFRVKSDECPKIDMNLIANAVLTGSDGVFLKTGALNSRETVELLKNVDIVCREAESARWQKEVSNQFNYKIPKPLDPSHAIIVGAIETSLKSNAAAIIVTTMTGRSAVLLSTYRPKCPIVAVTRYGAVARWLQLYYGLHSFHYKNQPLSGWANDMETRIQSGVDFLRRKKYIKVGDVIIIVTGWREGAGFANCIRIIYVSPGYTESEILNCELCT
ncbi:pyruvate kinase PKM-like [Osmia bicornis bicornis]|uniref:pyruvate kinase PKM-like n=1 Tax=Osmia bicornis bicornis TaxID=1437191 RepID=UPI001EAED8D2|nr:pyruvate kinase PKM-like [Osmia bicornis bicornis]